MNRRADGTAREPGVPGPRGASAGGVTGTDATALSSLERRPVTGLFDAAGAPAAAPSNRGDNLSVAAGANASTVDDDLPERDGSRQATARSAVALDLHEGISTPGGRKPYA